MKRRTVTPAGRGLRGRLTVPSDKSIAHRALLFGAIAEGATTVRGFQGGRDNRATMAACRALGVAIDERAQTLTIAGRGCDGLRAPTADIDCENSGTTMRLLTGLLAGRPFPSRLVGDASLLRRPMRRVIEPLARMGASITSEPGDGRAPLRIDGRPLVGATHALAVASAQVKSAILLAGLQARGTTRVSEPARSRDHTERLLRDFGVALRGDELWVELDGPQRLRGTAITLPGDFSSAAFLLVAAALIPGSELHLTGVGINPTRTGLLDVLAAMGAAIEVVPEAGGAEPVGTLVVRHRPLHATRIAGDVVVRSIDEFPVLCIAAACAEGTTEIRDAAELRVKESDRVAVMAGMLRDLGVVVEELPDGLVITGAPRLGGARVDPRGDHRIAMAGAVAGLVGAAPVVIDDPDCAEVSFPGFYATLAHAAGA
ncbi:MAG: 3-phosphoshikimate 1-carboxyvinyltransferase [Deltaproteobacteria bacterium]|nr:3-phosphoshikimate 1-carboxyvinyltransferase [Deltaproteobacteria bacterium]